MRGQDGAEVKMIKSRGSDAVDKHVGERVRLRRIMLGMSQTELGSKIGVTFQQIQKYEKGTNRIGAGRLYKVAQVLDVHPSFFFEDLAKSKGRTGDAMPPYLIEVMSTALGQKLVEGLSRVPGTKMRNTLLQLVENMAGQNSRPRQKRKYTRAAT
jgi:transcriptional regulator with XRE-family HTH domain